MDQKRDSWLHLESASKYAVGAGYWLHHYHPNRRRLTQLVALLVALVVAVLSFRLGGWYNGYHFEAQDQALATLSGEVARLRRERSELLSRLASAERTARIATSTSADLKSTLARLEVEAMELRKELGFYKGLVTPIADKRQLRLNDVVVEPGQEPRSYRYQITLTQVLGRGKTVRGAVELRLEGKRHGKDESVPLARLSSSKQIPFAFKYYQRLTGTLVLPEGFEPTRVWIQIKPKTRGLSRQQESLAWIDALSGGAS